MKKTLLSIVALLVALICALSFVACDNKTENTEAETLAKGEEIAADGLWKDAIHRSDVTVGKGEKTIKIDVVADGKQITVKLKTDEATLGEAMYAEGLINDATFFNVLNGIEASWEKDQAYWAFYQGETMMPHGVNDENISGGESYRFVYTK